MQYFVYILKSLKDGKYYIGSSENVEARVEYHNAGKQRSTKRRIPFILVYTEEHPEKKSALIREKEIKRYKVGNALKNLIGGK